MSTQFSKGDRVRKTTVEHTVMGRGFTDHGEEFAKKGAVGTVTDVEAPALMWVEWDEGTASRINVEHLEKVEPEWTVGQKVSGDDYAKLPIGSVVLEEEAAEMAVDGVKSVPIAKTGEDAWTNQGHPGVFVSEDLSYDERTLTHLPDAAEPEDKDDLYVEPEPLADWERALLDEVDSENTVTINTLDREEIHRFIACLPADWGLIDERDGSTLSETVDQVIEALREFANPKPARCASLWADPFATDPTTLRRCKFDAGHDERHRADWSAPTGHNQSATWADGGAYGRVEVSS